MQKAPPTPKGFRDIPPDLAAKRRKTINIIADVLEKYGFVPLETPTIEFADTLTGKYGQEERLIYKFTDRGGRELALRYDLTVPLARFIANNQNLLTPSFSRYQIGQVFRGENPQHGRYREFMQFDFDTVGSNNLEEDAKVIATALKAVKSTGLKTAKIFINDRKWLDKTFKILNVKKPDEVAREIDKIGKKPQAEIDKFILSTGTTPVSAVTVSGTISSFDQYSSPPTAQTIKSLDPNVRIEKIQQELKEKSENLQLINLFQEPESIKDLREEIKKFDIDNSDIIYERRLVRGLDYYTGFIFEMKPSEDFSALTIGSGGRYDNLVGMFAGRQIPAVGFSFGIDRLIEALDEA